LYRRAVTDQFGRYALSPVASGEYKLFAWEEVEDGAWRDPDFLKEHEKHGARVTLTVNERKAVQLKTAPMLP
jgi:hypothetical protein